VSDRLSKAMGRLSAESAKAEVPPEIEAALLGEFDRRSRRRNAMSWTIAAGAIAASIALVLSLEYPSEVKPDVPAAVVAEVAPESDQPFVPIPYVAPLGPYEQAQVVRMEVPVSQLIAAGLPMRTTDVGAQAEADVVVGQDGRARAVRLVSVSSTE